MQLHFLHRWLINLMILASLLLLGMGVFLPMMTLEKFYFFENQVSLFTAINDLRVQKEWLLYFVILTFSIIFPIIKSLFLILVVNSDVHNRQRHRRLLRWLAGLGKWSMLDVFVVALLLVIIKLDMIANVQVHSGVYAFAASVMLTMLLTNWLNWLEHRSAGH